MARSPRSPVTSMLPSTRGTFTSFSSRSAHQRACLPEAFTCRVWKHAQTNRIKQAIDSPQQRSQPPSLVLGGDAKADSGQVGRKGGLRGPRAEARGVGKLQTATWQGGIQVSSQANMFGFLWWV